MSLTTNKCTNGMPTICEKNINSNSRNGNNIYQGNHNNNNNRQNELYNSLTVRTMSTTPVNAGTGWSWDPTVDLIPKPSTLDPSKTISTISKKTPYYIAYSTTGQLPSSVNHPFHHSTRQKRAQPSVVIRHRHVFFGELRPLTKKNKP
jgi:hypothetical protein